MFARSGSGGLQDKLPTMMPNSPSTMEKLLPHDFFCPTMCGRCTRCIYITHTFALLRQTPSPMALIGTELSNGSKLKLAAIAHWICQSLPSFDPWFEYHRCFYANCTTFDIVLKKGRK